MNPLIILPIAITVLLIIVFNEAIRNRLLGCFEWLWGTIAGNAPTFLTVLEIVLAIMILVLGILWFLFDGWFSFLKEAGILTASPIAFKVVFWGSLIWLFFSRLRPFVGMIVLVAGLVMAFGYFAPITKEAIPDYSAAKDADTANRIRVAALELESEGKTPAVVIEDSFLYDASGALTGTKVSKGDEVRTVGLKEVQFPASAEKFVQIMARNPVGDFQGGDKKILLPSRKLKFGTTAKAEEEARKSAAVAETKANQLAEEVAKAEALEKARLEFERKEAEKNAPKQDLSANQQQNPVIISPKSLVTVFPATIQIIGGKQRFETLEVLQGKYRVSPADTEINLGEGWKVRNGGRIEITNSRQTIGVLSPTGNTNVTIYKEG